ncbi:MAG: dTDP-4-dehydrorhamnose 3,5-epimerase [Gammaproteobacteria bacterium]|nr:dTDP-4-dehydrorhamnose 3,5-epimerase [Gammaproteobacteria bacterium]
MKVTETALPGVLIIEPRTFQDSRGYFYETFHAERYEQFGIKEKFIQDNFSSSVKNVIRGLHYQMEHAQGKLVYVTYGHVVDVVVDIRVGSPAFGKSITVELNDQNNRQIFIPPGLAHGFCVLSDRADFLYKCTDFYYPASEFGICWNDPVLQIAWPRIEQPILSIKDSQNLYLKDIPAEKLPIYDKA